MTQERTTVLFFELFSGLPRQGPGDATSTLRALALVPGIGPETGHLWVGIGFVISGGIITLIWQVGDDQPIRSFIFGATWPPLVAALTR